MNNAKIRALDMTALCVFAALMEEGSVVRAADRLGMTQSAVSHALRRLRTLWDDPLFVRSPSGMAPTAKARRLAPGVADAVRDLARLVEPGGVFDPSRAARQFTIGLSDYAAAAYLPRLLAREALSAEGVSLRVRHTSRALGFDMLRRGEVELVIGNYPEAPADLRQEPLADQDFVCAAAEGHPAFAGSALEMDGYLDAEHLHVSLAGEPYGPVDAALTKIGRKRRVAVTVPHFLLAGTLLPGTRLISTEPRAVLTPMAEPFGLVLREPPFDAGTFGFSMLWHRRADSDPGLDWLRGALTEEASSGVAM